MLASRGSRAPDDIEARILSRLAGQLDRHYACWVGRDRAIHFRTIPGLAVTTIEDGDGLHQFCASFLGTRNGLTVHQFALDEFDRLLAFLGVCALSASVV